MIIRDDIGSWEDGRAKTVTFIVTKDCQLACKYCYLVGKNSNERMSFDVARQAVDYLLDNPGLFNERSVIFEFIGGEPFMEIDLIDRICDYIKEQMFVKNSMRDLETWEQNILMKCLEDCKPLYAREVDKPVTPDIKRLIRLPGSLHGKTGLRVHPITRDELTDYNPLMCAVPDVYTDDPVKVTMKKDMDLKMLDFSGHLSGRTEVPEFAAAFLVGRKYADYGWDDGEKSIFF